MAETHQLTELQIALMRVLWDRGEASAAEVTEALREDRGLAYNTVATVLSRLEKRGVVGHETRQRQYVYHPLVSEAEVRHSMMQEMTERLFQGDVAAVMSHLLTGRDVSPGDLDRMKALLEEHAARKENSDAR